jgi:hypothetical protein
MNDIVDRLRKPAPPMGFEEYDPTFYCRQDAAAEIERVRKVAAEIKARSTASSSDDEPELRRQMMHIASLADSIGKPR